MSTKVNNLKSFYEINSQFESVFNTSIYPGLSIKTENKIDEESTLSSEVILQPIMISFHMLPNGRIGQSHNTTTIANILYKKSNENGKISLSTGTSKYAQIYINPTTSTSIATRVALTHSGIKPVISLSYAHKYFHPVFEFSFQDKPLITINGNKFQFFNPDQVDYLMCSCTFGIEDLSFGCQFKRKFIYEPNAEKRSSDSLSFIANRNWDKNKMEVAFVYPDSYPMMFVWRYIKTINKNWQAGVSYVVDSNIDTHGQIFYSAKIGKNSIFATINSQMRVMSIFDRKILLALFEFVIN